jgi:hypothetical protein
MVGKDVLEGVSSAEVIGGRRKLKQSHPHGT